MNRVIDMKSFLQGMCYLIVFHFFFFFSIKVSYNRFFQMVLTLGVLSLWCANFGEILVLDFLVGLVGWLVVMLWNVTVGISLFYPDTPGCCIPWWCSRVPVHCSPLRHWKAVGWYTFFYKFAPLLHRSLSTYRTASSLNNHRLLPKKNIKELQRMAHFYYEISL